MKKKVLLICIGNCCRSPMAEGLWKDLAGDEWEVYSAGTSSTGYVHPLAIAAMEDRGIDIRTQESKQISDLPHNWFDTVVTLSRTAHESLPVPPGDTVLHWPISDPYEAEGSERDRLAAFCAVRKEIEGMIQEYLKKK
jgi:arsenate reductase